MAVTGAMLFAAEASHLAVNPVFQIKFVLIGIGLANIAIYEFGIKRTVAGLSPDAPMPVSAKIAGALSLGIWVAVAACGRPRPRSSAPCVASPPRLRRSSS